MLGLQFVCESSLMDTFSVILDQFVEAVQIEDGNSFFATLLIIDDPILNQSQSELLDLDR